MTLAWQPSLLGSVEPAPDAAFAGLERHWLDEHAWVDLAPGWLAGADAVMAHLVEQAPWAQRHRVVFEQRHLEPRLTAALAVPLPPPLESARSMLGGRYGVDFDSCLLNLYRHGRDSVAWHRDRVHRVLRHPVVVTVSLGHRRVFLVRPHGGGRSRRFDVGEGDLLVMGGTCQHTWEHTVPKVAHAHPRLSVTLRHSQPPA